MAEQLLPCPFCGGAPKLRTHRSGEDSMECYVECPTCEVRTTYYEDAYAPTADATAAWNRRAPVTSLFGPYAHLNGPRALPEDSWSVEDDPIQNNEEYFSVPLFAQVEVTFPVTHGAPDSEAYRAYADELRRAANEPIVSLQSASSTTSR